MERRKSEKVFLVEGKYDKIRLESFLDAVILVTDGFGIFKDAEKRALLKTLAEKKGLVVLTDPDGAGAVIRGHIQTITGGKGVLNLYIPPIPGKERRKKGASKAGLLGVEGIDNATLIRVLEEGGVFSEGELLPKKNFTKADLYRLGLSGTDGADEKRKAILKKHKLPSTLSAKAMLEIVNLIGIDLTKEV